jgi:hypothetical protein
VEEEVCLEAKFVATGVGQHERVYEYLRSDNRETRREGSR